MFDYKFGREYELIKITMLFVTNIGYQQFGLKSC